jgi:hypothetical protein
MYRSLHLLQERALGDTQRAVLGLLARALSHHQPTGEAALNCALKLH